MSATIKRLYRYIDVHYYANAQLANEVVHGLFPDKLISVTEYNRLNPKDFVTSLPHYVRDASWFILSGESDQSQYFLRPGSEYYNSFRAFQGELEMPPNQEPIPLYPDKAYWYQWGAEVMKNDPKDNPFDLDKFVRHLAAVGKNATNPERYGYPGDTGIPQAVLRTVATHAQAVTDIVRPFLKT
jgi:hypothetical protein